MKIQLDEWTSTELPLADEKVIEQLLLLQKRNIIEVNLTSNGIKVSANSMVGFEGNQNLRIAIKPKISGFSVLKMIGYIHGFIPIKYQENAYLGEGEVSLFDLLIVQWLDLVEKLTPKLRQNYITIQEKETYIKGKIRVGELAKQGIVTPKTPVEYQVLNIDQTLNQMIKAGLSYYKQQTLNPYLVNQINLLLRDYTPVKNIYLNKNEIESKISRLTRLEKDYRVPLKYLNWLLSLSGMGSNSERGNSLWINMNSLFQDYLTAFLERYSVGYRLESEVSNRTIFKYDSEYNPLNKSSISIRPDLLVYDYGGLRNIIDFKYKNYTDHSISTSDLYQLSNYGLTVGEGNINPIILYPTEREFPDQVIDVNLANLNIKQKITVRGVNLNHLQVLIDLQDHAELSNYAETLLN
ncbi:McrC family protein [Aerococcus urinaeequi]|uniref:McrC family protein n=1 Tax=Aerococcus urinaeequi TaxID=51665 RepID=UPI003B3ADA54